MRSTRRTRAVAPLLALTLGAAACGGGAEDAADGGTPGGPTAGGSFSVQIGQPENPLVPGNTSETEGGQVVDALWTGLVTYDPQSAAVQYDGVAESITSDDSTTWTVKLKPGWTFHDGTPVVADSFVDAWNYTALSTNAQGNSYFFDDVQGYQDLQAKTDDDGKVRKPPKAEQMSGLQVVDPLTFTVTLSKPFTQWPIKTGYAAFFPMPDAFFKDPEALGVRPVGNGPFKADTDFVDARGITLSRYEAYTGGKAEADKVELRVFSDVNTAYTEAQGDTLDIMTPIPPDAIASFKDDFPGRFLERESSSFT